MKRKSILIHVQNAFLGITFICCLISEAKAQGTVTFSEPGNSMNYQHDGTNWIHKTNSTFTYNTAGQRIEEIQQDPITNQNKFRSTKTYDSFGNQIAESTFKWQNSTWTLTARWRDSIVYFSGNKKATIITKYWQNNTWKNYTRLNYTYDNNNYLIEETHADWDSLTSTWQFYNKTIYTNDAKGIITAKEYFGFQNGTWVPGRSETNFTWHTPNILPATYNHTTPNGLYPHRHTITLGPNGGYTKLEEYYYTPSNTWRNLRRETEVRDFRGNLINWIIESYNTGSWKITSEHQNIYTYNSIFDITEKIIRYPDPGPQNGGPVKDRYKYVYSNFQYFTRALGTNESKEVQLNVNVYPNPATDNLQIEFSEQKPQNLMATISDLTGKIWKKQSFKATEAKQLSIETLPKGIYILQLQTEAGSTIKRIVKQ